MEKLSLLLLAAGGSLFAQTARVQCNPAGSIVNCRVDNPVVTQRSFTYQAITFKPGDKVTVNAGGCVQTGGHGKTWKAYVNPSGPNSDRLYHGLINIPGVSPAGSLQRISAYVGKTFTVASGINPASSFLILGYEDDGYGDNGYTAHDDGTENQCKNVGNAWVTLAIDRTPGTVVTPTAAPFDLEWPGGVDRNGIPLNPQWHAEANTTAHPDPTALCNAFPYLNPSDPSRGIGFGNPACTTQSPSIDRPSGTNAFLCEHFGATAGKLDGHVNWMPATYTGHVIWNGHKDWTQIGDDDYNIDLQPSNAKGLTKAGPDHIELEFDSDETIDHFNSTWWNQFHSAVDSNSGESGGPAGAMIDGHSAIAIGLMNLDAEHDAHSELHPLWGLAIRLSKDNAINPNDDAWAVFARNWGNEGFCSQDQHYLDLSSLSFYIPGQPGSTVTLTSSEFHSNRNDVASAFTSEPGGGLLSFQLGAPENGAMIEGTIHLKWTGGAPLLTTQFGTLQPQVAAKEPPEKGEALLAQVPSNKKAALAAALKKPAAQKNAVTLTPRVASGAKPGPQVLPRPRTRSAPDAKKAAKDKQRMQALCSAFGDQVPGAPAGVCASVK